MTETTLYKFLRAFRAPVCLWIYSLTLIIPCATFVAGASGRIMTPGVLRPVVARTLHSLIPTPAVGQQNLNIHQGSLAQGGSVLHYYQTPRAGLHELILLGPAGADFSLSLEAEVIRNVPGRPPMVVWVPVAQSDAPTADEYIAYQGLAQGAQLAGGGSLTGLYKARIVSKQGGGNYTLWISYP
jgi:hypothetical protein